MWWEKTGWSRERSSLALAVFVVLGCEGSTGSSATTPTDVQSLIDAFCGMARACCARANLPPEPLTDCEAEFARQTDFMPLIERGTVVVDEAELGVCVGAVMQTQTTCFSSDVEGACTGVFVGTRNDGDACADVAECRSQSEPSICLRIRGPDGGDPASGTCRVAPRGAEGDACFQTCARDQSCRYGYSTDVADPVVTLCHEADGLFCGFQVCERLRSTGDACDMDDDCGSGSFCDTTCQPRGGVGASCRSPFGCVRGLACMEGRCQKASIATDKLCSGDYN